MVYNHPFLEPDYTCIIAKTIGNFYNYHCMHASKCLASFKLENMACSQHSYVIASIVLYTVEPLLKDTVTPEKRTPLLYAFLI